MEYLDVFLAYITTFNMENFTFSINYRHDTDIPRFPQQHMFVLVCQKSKVVAA